MTTALAPKPLTLPAVLGSLSSFAARKVRDYLTSLNLPPCPTRLVAGNRLRPIDLREIAALKAMDALGRSDRGGLSMAEIAASTKMEPREATIAARDLAGAGQVEIVNGIVWLRGARS